MDHFTAVAVKRHGEKPEMKPGERRHVYRPPVDTKPRPKAPREHAERPKDFGKSIHIRWHQPRTLDELVGLRHAEIQHHFALRVKSTIRGRVTQPEVADACDFARTRFNEVLNGRSWLRFDDAVRIEQVVGPILFGMKFERLAITHPNLVDKFPRRMGRQITDISS